MEIFECMINILDIFPRYAHIYEPRCSLFINLSTGSDINTDSGKIEN